MCAHGITHTPKRKIIATNDNKNGALYELRYLAHLENWQSTLTFVSKEIFLIHLYLNAYLLFSCSILSSVLPLCSKMIQTELTILIQQGYYGIVITTLLTTVLYFYTDAMVPSYTILCL